VAPVHHSFALTRCLSGLRGTHPSANRSMPLVSGLRSEFGWQLFHDSQAAAQFTPACATIIAGNHGFVLFWHHSLLVCGPKRLFKCSNCLAETFRFRPASSSSRAAICHASGFWYCKRLRIFLSNSLAVLTSPRPGRKSPLLEVNALDVKVPFG
jgi:hypothetical protein